MDATVVWASTLSLWLVTGAGFGSGAGWAFGSGAGLAAGAVGLRLVQPAWLLVQALLQARAWLLVLA